MRKWPPLWQDKPTRHCLNNSVGLWIAESVYNDVTWWQVDLSWAENSVPASSPYGLSNLSVGNWVTVQRYFVSRSLEVEASGSGRPPQDSNYVGFSVV